jgi:hypothetical protein
MRLSVYDTIGTSVDVQTNINYIAFIERRRSEEYASKRQRHADNKAYARSQRFDKDAHSYKTKSLLEQQRF